MEFAVKNLIWLISKNAASKLKCPKADAGDRQLLTHSGHGDFPITDIEFRLNQFFITLGNINCDYR